MWMVPSDHSQIEERRFVFASLPSCVVGGFFPVVLALSLMPFSSTDTRNQLL